MDRNKSKYAEIVRTLQEEMRDGRYRSSSEFPSVCALMRRFGVARATVARAVSVLRQLGLVRSRVGARTVVTRKGRSVSGNHTISSAAISFAPDALNIQSSAIFINLNSDAAVKAISSGEFTIEIIGFIEAITAMRFFWITSSNSISIARDISLMTHNTSGLFILQKLGDISNVVSHGTDTAHCTAYGNIVAHLVNQTTHNVIFYKNGLRNTSRKCTQMPAPAELFINSFVNGPVGKYYALRIYNRPLAEVEIITNYEIDRNRFHLD